MVMVIQCRYWGHENSCTEDKMSFDPDTEENVLRKQKEEIQRVRQEGFFASSNTNAGNGSSGMGTSTGYGGLNSGSTGDDPIEVLSAWGESVVGGAIDVANSLVKVVRDAVNDVSGEAKINRLNGSNIEGHVFYIKPKANETVRIVGTDPTSNESTDGNVLSNDDIVITDRQIAKFRFQKDVTFTDGGGGWILESKSDATGGGSSGSSSGLDSWKQPARINGTGTLDLTPDPSGNWINSLDLIWGLDTTGTGDLIEGDRVLLTGMALGNLNGLWELTAETTTFPPISGTFYKVKRPADFDSSVDVVGATFVPIADGIHKDELWHLTTLDPITLDDLALPVVGNIQTWEEFVGGSSGGGGLPVGSENQHLEWRSGVWEARTNLEFGATGPFANAGFIRFPNATALISWRNQLDDGNMAIKVTDTDWFDITHDKDILEDSSVKFRLRAQSPFASDNYDNPAFEIVQLPDDNIRLNGEPFFATEMRYPALMNIWRGHTGVPSQLVLTLDQSGNMNHWNHGGFQIKFLQFFAFGSPLGTGSGSQISRYGTADGTSNPDGFGTSGLHYDVENSADTHVFRVGDGTTNMFSASKNPQVSKWIISQSSNITTQPIFFSGNDIPVGVGVSKIYHQSYDIGGGVQQSGLAFQNGFEAQTGYGRMEFRDNTDLPVDTGIRVNFDFEGNDVSFNHLKNGMILRVNDDNTSINMITMYPAGNSISFQEGVIWSESDNDGTPFSGLSIRVGPLVLGGAREKMKITEGRTWCFNHLYMEGFDVVNTGNVWPDADDTYDIGIGANSQYHRAYIKDKVFTDKIGDWTTLQNEIQFNSGQMLFKYPSFGSYRFEHGGVQTLEQNGSLMQIHTDVLIRQGGGSGNPKIKFEKQTGGTGFPAINQGNLWARDVDTTGEGDFEVHPFWIGDGMTTSVDLLDQSGLGGGGSGISIYHVKSWTDQLTDPTVGVINGIDDIFFIVGDKVLLTNTPDPIDNGVYEVTGFIVGILIATLKRVDGLTNGVEMQVGSEVWVEHGELGEGAKFRLMKISEGATNSFARIGIDPLYFKTVWRKPFTVINGTVSPLQWGEEPYPPRSLVNEADYIQVGNVIGFVNNNGGWARCEGVGDNVADLISSDTYTVPSFEYTVTQSDIDKWIFNPPKGFLIEQITFFLSFAGTGTTTGGAYLITQNGHPMWNDPIQTSNLDTASTYFGGYFVSSNSTNGTVGFPNKMNNPALKVGDKIAIFFKTGVAVPNYTVDDVAIWLVPQKLNPDGHIGGMGGFWIASEPAGSWARGFATDSGWMEFDKYYGSSNYNWRQGTLNGVDMMSGMNLYVDLQSFRSGATTDDRFYKPRNEDGVMGVYVVGY